MMSDDALRARIEQCLRAGLPTEWRRRAGSADEVRALCQRLQGLPAYAIEAKLAAAGFTLTPYVDSTEADGIEQSCATCMYFERHRQFCDLPELMLPVEPQWSCTLWRI